MSSKFGTLRKKFPLPPAWRLGVPFTAAVPVGEIKIDLVGLVAESGGRSITGSAGGLDGHPWARAYFELLERISILEAEGGSRECFPTVLGSAPREIAKEQVFPKSTDPTDWNFAKSNGVALGLQSEDAAIGSLLELVERDRVLAHWDEGLAPKKIPVESGVLELNLTDEFEIDYRDFGVMKAWGKEIFVCGAFAFPKTNRHPLIMGFGAGLNLAQAIEKARAECVQRLGFLWDYELEAKDPEFSPTADFHQDVFLTYKGLERIKTWFEGHPFQSNGNMIEVKDVSFVDLTPDSLKGKLAVVKAVSPELRNLVFGRRMQENSGFHPVF